MIFNLPVLSYKLDAFEPNISRETLEYHYGKHHKSYVINLNKLVNKHDQFKDKNLEEIICTSSGSIFNNAAQHWNHTFYWNGLDPNGNEQPSGCLLKSINKYFGSYNAFKEEFTNVAMKTFGSGWVWLIKQQDSKLKIISTSNAETPLTTLNQPLLTCDVWEHAYYIDYRNSRLDYLNAFWKIVDWNFVSVNYK